jgi:peptidoglycan/xylan/chitin deacetylase (PgdA/CDA1 family)
MLPILQKYDLSCVFFVTTAFIDNESAFYRHKVSLCIEELTVKASRGEGIRQVVSAISKLAGRTFVNLPDCFQWIKTLKYADTPTIDVLCEIADVSIKEFLKSAPYLSKQQLLELAAAGFTIGAHGITHVKLDECGTAEEVEREIVESCEYIRNLVQADKVPFAFPFSGKGVSRDFLQAVMQRYTGVSLFFDTQGLAKDEPMIVNRTATDSRGNSIQPKGGACKGLIREAIENEAIVRCERTIRSICDRISPHSNSIAERDG